MLWSVLFNCNHAGLEWLIQCGPGEAIGGRGEGGVRIYRCGRGAAAELHFVGWPLSGGCFVPFRQGRSAAGIAGNWTCLFQPGNIFNLLLVLIYNYKHSRFSNGALRPHRFYRENNAEHYPTTSPTTNSNVKKIKTYCLLNLTENS